MIDTHLGCRRTADGRQIGLIRGGLLGELLAVTPVLNLPGEVHRRCLQARSPQSSEVVGILRECGPLTRLDEGLNSAVGVKIKTGTRLAFIDQATLIELRKVAVIGNALIARRNRMDAQRINERCTPGIVVDFTGTAFGVTAELVTTGSTGRTAVLAIGRGLEITQIGFQRTVFTERQHMQQTGEVLLVIVFEIGVVILSGQILREFVIATGKGKFIAFLIAARNGQTCAIAG